MDQNDIWKELDYWKEISQSLASGEHIVNVNPEDTIIGSQLLELQKLRQDFDKYRAEQAADKAAAEHSAKITERKGFWFGILSNVVAAIIGGLVVYYWPTVISFLASLFQSLTS